MGYQRVREPREGLRVLRNPKEYNEHRVTSLNNNICEAWDMVLGRRETHNGWVKGAYLA